MKYRRKRHFTILETLIAVSITAVLLTLIFGFFRELSQISAMAEEMQEKTFCIRYTEMRLAYLFERMVNDNNETKREFFFFSDRPDKGILEDSASLVFSFNNEARANPAFAGDLLARLFIDPDYQLSLAMWPIFSDHPHEEMQKEVLLENVVDLSFEFYMPPEKVTQKNPDKIDTQGKEPERDRWHTEWLRSYGQMPALVRLSVKVADHPEDLKKGTSRSQVKATNIGFAFVLPSSKNYIYYPP